MVYFLGVFGPGAQPRRVAAEAPSKASFFGGQPDFAWGAVPMSRAEQDACFLQGAAPEPERRPRLDPRTGGVEEE
jgi:hypothetical protein